MLLLVLSACSDSADDDVPEEAAVFVGADGVTVESPDTSRIVTLSGDLTEFVFELGLGASIVATDVTTVAPDEAVLLPKAGIGRFLTPEGVLKHNPTLVVADTQTSPATAIEQIRTAGVPVAVLEVPTTFDGLHTKVTSLGLLLGTSEAAADLNARLESEIAAASVIPDDSVPAPRVAYVYTRGPDVMLLFGEGMTTTPVIEAAGGLDAGVDAGVEGNVPVTPEALAAAAPDVLVVPEEGYAVLGGIEGLLAIPGVAATPAGVNRAVFAYPEGDFLTFGPRIAASIERLVTDLGSLSIAP
ncbi:MAG: ABC transporter substrate-binding protein [Actinomycetota bacterium]|nr:ABC transporter substrate-binding protein [Actinomycetota bacterium]